MKHERVKRLPASDPSGRRAKQGSGPDRYDLALALRIVRKLETSAGRGAVFAEITSKNPVYRLVDTVYARAGAWFLQPLLLFAYMLKCVLSVGPFRTGDAAIVSISQFGNEHHTIDRFARLVPEARLLRLTLNRGHLIGSGQLQAAARMLGSLPRIWPFLALLARTHSFMPAARIASALAFYMRFRQLFADRPALAAAVVASNYSPEALGLAAAAHQAGRRVIYLNHAPVPANGVLMPPVLAECAIFYGERIRQTYERRGRCHADVALIGQPWIARPMQWRDAPQTVGIFLTAGTRTDTVAELVRAISSGRPGIRILIRNHPVALLKCDFSDLAADYPNVSVTLGNPLDDEIAACDLILCGNSGVAMNAVSGGCPVAYMDGLDRSGFDYNGFVETGLIYNAERWSEDIYGKLKAFYDRAEWRAVMRSYDASYEADTEALERMAAGIVRRHIGPVPATKEG